MESEAHFENLVFRDGSSATIHVTALGGERYRIVGPEVAILCQPLAFHDVIEAHRDSEGRLVVDRRVEKSSAYRTFDYMLREGWNERPSVRRILDKVRELGGDWEGIFGGILIICLPRHVDYDPSKEIAEAME